MCKTIKIRPQLEECIYDFCDDELNYHINESGCAEDYEYEIMAQIELLELLGYKDTAEEYRHDYRVYQAKHLWESLEDVPMNPETECIEEKWQEFPAGTHREEIWHWFEEKYNVSVAEDLM